MSEREKEREAREGKEGGTETQAKSGGSHHLHTNLNRDSPLSRESSLLCCLSLDCHHLCPATAGVCWTEILFPVFSQLCSRMLWPKLLTFSSEKCVSRLEFPSTLLSYLLICGLLEGDSITASIDGVSDTEKETWQGTSWLGWSITYYYHYSC